MKVLLLEEVENLGEAGEIVTVKDGYGRNFLIPRGLARIATEGVVKAWQEERRQAALDKKERKMEQERRRLENQYKNAAKSMQILNHSKLSSTLRSLSKKQLRHVEQTRVDPQTGAVQLVPAYSKDGATGGTSAAASKRAKKKR